MNISDENNIEFEKEIQNLRVNRKLLELLVCPLTKDRLRFDRTARELISTSAFVAYPIRDGIPIMLPDESRKIESRP